LGRISLAFQAFFSLLFGGKLSDGVLTELNLVPRVKTPPKPEAPAVKTSDGALQLLGIFQRDARLVDFLMEDLSSYGDEQVGAAVRSLHESSRKTLLQYFRLSPVIDGVEGAFTKVSDAKSVKLVGNVPPDGKAAGGVLRHRGWRVDSVSLPAIAPKSDVALIAPAEVEVE
jgi:hypothetical protein